MNMVQNKILDKNQILQKTRRIAYEIYENNFEEEEIILAGIEGEGYFFAQMLLKELNHIAPIEVFLVKVSLLKFTSKQTEISLDCVHNKLINKSIILVDDVLSTGRTLAYCLKPFMELEIKRLQTAVIVDRNHKLFPISADYTGYTLSTTIKESVIVILSEDEQFGAYLH